jgi:molecular chaperone DnaJ
MRRSSTKGNRDPLMDFYIVLGIEPGATLGDIKRAYRRLARKFHPDINPGNRMAASQFRRIVEAYETLSDPERRREYDTGDARQSGDAAGTVDFQGFDFSASVSGAAAPTFGDLFADILQSREHPRTTAPTERGPDIHQSLAFSFDDAMRGGQRAVTITRQEHCPTCEGKGRLATAERRCVPCHGTGQIQSTRGHMVFSKSCSDCRGTGWLADMECPGCGGQQTRLRTETLTINVPAGLANGARIRVPDRGHAGRHGGAPGDLQITVQVEPHPLFRRDGDDLHVVVPLAIHEAALGARIEVPTPGGVARLRVPPGTQSGQRFRLRERGVPAVRDGRLGDLVVEVRLALPKRLDERSKELLREFGQLHPEDVRKELM